MKRILVTIIIATASPVFAGGEKECSQADYANPQIEQACGAHTKTAPVYTIKTNDG